MDTVTCSKANIDIHIILNHKQWQQNRVVCKPYLICPITIHTLLHLHHKYTKAMSYHVHKTCQHKLWQTPQQIQLVGICQYSLYALFTLNYCI